MKLLLALCGFLLSISVWSADMLSQMIDPLDGNLDASQWLSENAYGFMPVPIIITEPALGTGGGLVGLFFHESDEEKQQRMDAAQQSENASAHLLPPSVTAVAGAATSNGTWLGGVGHMGFWKQDSIRYAGFAGYGSVNLDYYSSEDTKFFDSIELNTEGTVINQKLKFRIPGQRLFLGVEQHWMDTKISPNNLNGSLDQILPPGIIDDFEQLLEIDAQISGLGIITQFDSRNNIFTPTQGYNYEMSYRVYDDLLGSDYDYNYLYFEGLNYWPVGKSFIASLRLQADTLDTDELIPIYVYPSIQMRGIPAMRYQGEAMVLGEFEGRWLINQRWSINAFAGVGRTGEDLDDIKDNTDRFAKGIGFRYNMARRYGFHMGIDVAQGPEDTAWYIQAGSAW